MKKCIAIIMLFCNTICYGQAKRIELRNINIATKHDIEYVNFIINTDNNGIIQRIDIENSNVEYVNPRVVVVGNTITYLLNYHDTYSVLYKMENNLLTFEPDHFRGHIIKMNPRPGIIYESDSYRLERHTQVYLEETYIANGDNHAVLTYRFNTAYHYFSRKYEYKKRNKDIAVNYYSASEGDSYHSQKVIEIIGDNIYSQDMKINILNYFILSYVGNITVSSVFFPMLFLETPFYDFSQEITHYMGYGGELGDIYVGKDKFTLYFVPTYPSHGNRLNVNGDYNYRVLEERNGMKIIEYNDKKAVILESANMFCFLADEFSFVGRKFTDKPTSRNIGWVWSGSYSASSFLTEKEKKYEAGNLARVRLDNPWAEGVQGSGVGQIINARIYSDTEISALFIVNGYISARNPGLYAANNRVKRLMVYPEGGRIGQEITLEDTARPQLVRLNFRAKTGVRLEILEVYRGARYDDTCLSMILMVGANGLQALGFE